MYPRNSLKNATFSLASKRGTCIKKGRFWPLLASKRGAYSTNMFLEGTVVTEHILMPDGTVLQMPPFAAEGFWPRITFRDQPLAAANGSRAVKPWPSPRMGSGAAGGICPLLRSGWIQPPAGRESPGSDGGLPAPQPRCSRKRLASR